MKLSNSNKNKLIYISILLTISIFISLSNYIRIPLSGISDFIKYAIHFTILSAAVTGILLLISTQRWLFAVTSPLILLISLASATSLYFYNITVTSEIIEVVLTQLVLLIKNQTKNQHIAKLMVHYIFRFSFNH